MPFHPSKLSLSNGQMKKIGTGMKKNRPVTIRLSKRALMEEGDIPILLDDFQLRKLQKARGLKGAQITLSNEQLEANKKEGGILPALLGIIGPAIASAITGFAVNKGLEAIDRSVSDRQKRAAKKKSSTTKSRPKSDFPRRKSLKERGREQLAKKKRAKGLFPIGVRPDQGSGLKPFGTGLKPFGTGFDNPIIIEGACSSCGGRMQFEGRLKKKGGRMEDLEPGMGLKPLPLSSVL